jgi:ubiquinol oxidase
MQPAWPADLYFFDSFQTSQPLESPRRPKVRNLYDVFKNICDDELEHVKTMKACQVSSWRSEAWTGTGRSCLDSPHSRALSAMPCEQSVSLFPQDESVVEDISKRRDKSTRVGL